MHKDIVNVPVFRELKDFSELPAYQPSGVGDPYCLNKGLLPRQVKNIVSRHICFT